MVVKIHADVDPGNPAQHRRRRYYKRHARPRASDPHQLRMFVQPERAGIRRETSDVENYTVPVLRIGQNPPAAGRCHGIATRDTHNNLSAAATATAVIAKLTHGPQRIAPAIIAIAKNGQNDRPNTNAVCVRNPFDALDADGRGANVCGVDGCCLDECG